MLLDEPSRGIDIGAKAEVFRLARRARPRRGSAIVFTTSEIDECFSIGHRIVVMRRGQSLRRVRTRCREVRRDGRLRRSPHLLNPLPRTESHHDLHRRRRHQEELRSAKLLIEGRAFLALALIIVVFSLLSPNFLTVDNLLIMTSHVAIFALLSLGMLLVVLTGGIDLSVGSTLGFSAVIAGFLLRGVPLDVFGVTLYPSVPVAVLLSVALGGVMADASTACWWHASTSPRSSRPWACSTWCAASRC